jgi:adenylate cyclase
MSESIDRLDGEPPGGTALKATVSQAAEFVFGRRPPRVLPEQVRRAIADNQRSSEILVCFAQFGAIAFFGSFYELTPKAFPPSVPFEPVPLALGLYAVFTALRLWLALRDRLNAFFLGLSVVVDIVVLMVTIWSFHLQYQQPAAIYLKAPTLFYVFILIALRAMRLEATYVVLAGAAAILGWSTLVVYAVLTDNSMSVTHSFVEYMTSSSILIGAEIDKLLSIGAVTTVLAVSIVRARRLLVAAATEANAASELSRFFAPEIAGEIRDSDAGVRPGDAVTREAAVMMIDLRGFSQRASQMAPVATMALLGDYQRRMVPVIQSHGGSIDKYLGDGIMATFGAVRPSGSYAADAFRAMEGVLEAADTWSTARIAAGDEPLRIGISVAVGPVQFGVVGTSTRLEFTVIGDVVNLSAKLEKHCKVAASRALATVGAFDLARVQGFAGLDALEPLPGQAVAGVAKPLDLMILR